MFYHWEANAPNDIFLRQASNSHWHEYTWRQVAQQVRCLASFLAEQGYPAGSRIGLLSANSVDWFVADLAIMLAGHVSVPLYPGQDVVTGRYILEHSEAQMVLLGPFKLAVDADSMIPSNVVRVAMRGCDVSCCFRLTDIIAGYAPCVGSPIPARDALLTLLYTAGTSGRPKGVMHTHGNVAALMPRMMSLMKQWFNQRERGRFYSYLPLAHATERILIEMLALYTNPTVSFSEGPEALPDELRSVKPTLFFSVPPLWMRFKHVIDAHFPPPVQATFGDQEKAFVRAHLGLDQAGMVLTGSAPTPNNVQQWFLDMGVVLRDCYIMAENLDAASYTDGTPEPGCVGKPAEGVAVTITDEGEICFKSNSLMKGYYREPEKSSGVLVDGWYHSGDRGRFDNNGNLWITGRIDEAFETSDGDCIRPAELEKRFDAVPDIAQMMVCGHGREQPVMLLTLTEQARVKKRAALILELERTLDEVNAELPAQARIARLFVTRDQWSIENRLLTPAMTLKRREIEGRYSGLIDAGCDAGRIVFE